MIMLTSSANQYLRPEYLSPLPTTLDAKKSPLALLAQTCSNIGIDTSSKPLISQIERPKEKDSERKKSGRDSSSVHSDESCNSVQSNKFSFKPYESSISSKKDRDRDRDSSDRSISVDVNDGKKSPAKQTPPTSHANKSSSVRVSPMRPSPLGGKNSPHITVTENGSNSVKSDNGKSESPNTNSSPNSSTSSTSNTITHTTSSLSDLARSMESHRNELSLHYATANKSNGLSYGSCCTTSPAAAALGSLKGADNKSQPYPTFLPYSLASYAAMKGANGGFLGTSVCRDPYCANCQLSAAAAAASRMSVCPSGCTQCNHDRIPTSLSALASGYPIPGLGHMASYGNPLYAHSYAPTGSSLVPQSNVCSWMVGGTYCGKRFATSEELLNHLRTHTNGTEVGAGSLLSPLTNLNACHSHYANLASVAASSVDSPSLTTAAGLRRTAYPSLSDVSSLANRYHPYKRASIPVIGGIPPATPPLSSLSPSAALSMYYPPYGLYGSRIGPPVHP